MNIIVNKDEVQKYVDICNNDDKFQLHVSSIEKLIKQFPKNSNIDEVLIKVCCVNSFYSTNIIKIEDLSRYIVSKNIDTRLMQGDLSLVNELAYSTKDIINRDTYSFMSKYCSIHNSRYPKFDGFVEKMLCELNKQDNFSSFIKSDLRDYCKYNSILTDFREFYNLNQFTNNEIDMFLWRAGKDYFSKPEKKQNDIQEFEI